MTAIIIAAVWLVASLPFAIEAAILEGTASQRAKRLGYQAAQVR